MSEIRSSLNWLPSPTREDRVPPFIRATASLLALHCLLCAGCSSSKGGPPSADASSGVDGASPVQPDGPGGAVVSPDATTPIGDTATADGAPAYTDTGVVPGNTLDGPVGDSAAVDRFSAYIEAGVASSDTAVAMDAAAPDLSPDSAPDTFSCPAGQTNCGGTCVDTLTNPSHCGNCPTDCTKLPGVDGTAAACLAGLCNINGACLPGRAHCSTDTTAGCETDLSQTSHCGDCATVCSEPTPLCADVGGGDSGTSRFSCTSGCTAPKSTRCSMSCVDTSTDARNCGRCGNACIAPQNGGVSCVSGACVVSCNTGFHLCGQICKSDLSTDSCGTSCSPCSPPPLNASATCDGVACGFTCNAGYHRCGDSCKANTDVTACGASCSPCPTMANGNTTCDGVVCGFTCNTGYHVCSGACASNTSVATCGSSCTPCAVSSANASATCNGVACDFTCNAGYTKCGTSCADITTDTNNCGGCGKTCSGTCTSGQCSVLFYDGFESGMGNWNVDGNYWQISSSVAASGSHSLRGTFADGCSITKNALLGRDIDLSGVTTATLQFISTATIGVKDSLAVLISKDGGYTWSTLSGVGDTSDWQSVTLSLSAYVGQPLVRIGFTFTNVCGDCCGVDWYIDDVRVTTP